MAKTPNVPAARKSTAVVNYQEQLANEAAEAASKEAALSEFVSFKSGILTFNGQAVPDNKKNVVVLDTAYEHAFYGDWDPVNKVAVLWPFDPNNPRSPSCYAMGRVESELKPVTEGDDAVQAAVTPEGCASCPLNEWASNPEGGKGKACKNVRRLTLLDADVLNLNSPEAVKDAATVYAKLPVTSGKPFSAFVIQTAQVVKRPLHGVVSEMSVVNHQTNQFMVNWTFGDMISDELMPAIMAKREGLGDDILFPYPPMEEEAPAPARTPARPAAKAPAKGAAAATKKKY